ncbi:AUXIN RESPONSE FACTOR [Salix viminalis]|uniref:AUXIN RESPONSE FACTOR n=1 Tax=Salix viminalis TaxID=40686 RepID=A0A9Q0V5A5_SALVM|nr:AUXIN RESPONSE FACTOR [Salix viminalis]
MPKCTLKLDHNLGFQSFGVSKSDSPLIFTFADDDSSDLDSLLKRTMPWLGDDICMKDPQAPPGLSLVQWMNMQQNPSLAHSMQPNYMQSLSGSVLQNLPGADLSRQLGMSSPQMPQPNNVQLNAQRLPQQAQQLDQLPKLQSLADPTGFHHTAASTDG